LQTIRASSPTFLCLIIAGGMLQVGSVLTLGMRTTPRKPAVPRPCIDLLMAHLLTECHASYWLFTIGFTMLYGSLVIKNYRILRIFSERFRNKSRWFIAAFADDEKLSTVVIPNSKLFVVSA
jgi:hypothetical protein